jgi:putative ABC transport system permease protein
MSEWLNQLLLRVKALWRTRQLDRDLDDEMAFHLAMREQSLREDGAAAGDARAAARRQFGNDLRVKESLRELWRWGAVDRAWQDVKFGIRLAQRQRSFTAVVVATLALGIGATTAMFTIVDAVVLRPFTLPDPDRLVAVWETHRERDINRFSGSVANYVDWQQGASSFSDLGAFENRTDNRTDGPGAEQINGAVASAPFFGALGIQPTLGRFFDRHEDTPAGRFVAVLGHEYWRRTTAGDIGVVGRSIVVNGEPHAIIGVMPPMRAPFVADIWRPLAADVPNLDRGDHNVIVVGRLAPGRDMEQAEAELQTIAARLQAAYPKTNTGWSVRIESLYDAIVEPPTRRSMVVLMGAVLVLLLIACLNVANLMLARGTRRWREISTRLALGASRSRVAAQLLAEAGVLSVLGAGAGLLVAVWALRLAEWVYPDRIGGTGGLQLNAVAIGFTMLVAVATTFIVGVAPALRVSRARFEGGLAPGGRRSSEPPRAARMRQCLVVAEIGLALMLLVGAGLLIRSVDRLRQEPLGFTPDGVITGKLGFYSDRYQSSIVPYASFIDRLVTDLERRPGVSAAGVASSVPFGGGYTVMQVRLNGAGPELEAGVQAQWRVIGGNYLKAMDIPLKAGRLFNAGDDARRATRVTIISESLAERLWPGEDPIGRLMLVSDSRRPYEVVGVTPATRLTLLGREPERAMYFHYLQFPWASMNLAVRTTGRPEALARTIRAAVAELDAELPVADIRAMSDIVDAAAASPQMNASLVTVFAVLALALAGIGIYGLMSYSAAQRTTEIGVRLALGAQPLAMFGMVWLHGLRLSAIGLALGLLGALVAGRALETLLYQVPLSDPVTYAVVFGVMLTVTVVACYVPARRAMRTDASVALRHD